MLCCFAHRSGFHWQVRSRQERRGNVVADLELEFITFGASWRVRNAEVLVDAGRLSP
jgi:hypothetical protein